MVPRPRQKAAKAREEQQEEAAERTHALEEGEPAPFLLKIRADLNNGSDLSFLSVFPCEAEAVYPPCTYFEARSSWDETVTLPSGDDLPVKIVEIVPRIGQAGTMF